MSPAILVTGGTGTLGRLVVPRLLGAGREVRVLSRRPHESQDGVDFRIGDLATGEGIAGAVEGVATIVHCAGSARGDEGKTRTLVQAAARAGGDAPHVVLISVVGAERIPVVSAIDRAMFGYFAAKRATEEIVAASGLPWTALRASQFHDLILTVTQAMAKLPVVPVPAGFRFQPVDATAVADRLADHALGDPSGHVPDVAGPRVYEASELFRTYLRAAHRRRTLLPVRIPGQAARAIRAGATLAPEQGVGRTWEEFLAERLHQPAVPGAP